jgi:extracellular elastinolytic metalloproteinase
MSREIDVRNPDDYVRFTLGADELPFGAQEQPGGFTERALALAELTTDVAGAKATQPIRFNVDPSVGTDVSGGGTVHLHQHHGGIDVFGAEQVVGFAPGGSIDHTQARLVAAAKPPEFSLEITSDRAVVIAAEHVAASDDAVDTGVDHFGQEIGVQPLDVSGLRPEPISVFTHLPELPTVFEPGPFAEPVRANLVWFPLAKSLRLAWDIALTLPRQEGAFQVIVAADDGQVLFSTQVMLFAAGRGNVYVVDPTRPREKVDFPRPWSAYDFDVPAALPERPPDWVGDGRTEGNTVIAFLQETHRPVNGSLTDGSAAFDPADAFGEDQRIVNAFYGACSMHDLMYMLGFREADGNYQEDTQFGGLPGHRVKVAVSTGTVMNLSSWWNGTIWLGLRAGTPRHTALDMTIVFHEYTHGVSVRLVGGARATRPLTGSQSRGMAEGWSDYVACTVTGATVVGGWTTDNPSTGLRRFAYDEHFPVEKANFGIIATLKQYEIGELWCAFLLEMNRRIGPRLGMQLVIEGMKGLMSNPSLLDGRNNMLLTLGRMRSAGRLTAEDHDAAKAGIWASSAKFGMGVGARSNGDSLDGIVADTSIP